MREIDFSQIDNLVKDKVISFEDIKKINSIMKENIDKNEDLKVLDDIQTNPPENPSSGKYEKAMVKIDPETGEKIKVEDYTIEDEVNIEDKLKNISNDTEENVNVVKLEDVKKATEDSNIFKNSSYEISDESALQLVKIINRYKAGEDLNIYNEFPKEIQKMIDQYIVKHGYGFGYTSNTNQIKKFLSKQLLDEYIQYIYKDKSKKSFSLALESMWKDTKTDIIDFYKDYPERKDYYLDTMMSNVDDQSKRDSMKSILDSIYDSYTLSRMINSKKRIKIRKIDLEKPDKAFREFEYKYRDKEECNILAPRVAYQILSRFLKDQDTALKFLLIFCKFCSSYNPDNLDQHMFMYYTLSNVSCLDIAKVKNDFAFMNVFLNNVKKVVENLAK